MNAKWITPAVTAMDSQGHVDMEANKAIYDFLIEKGMDGLLLLGSIGEFFAISTPEKKRLIRGGPGPHPPPHHRVRGHLRDEPGGLRGAVQLRPGAGRRRGHGDFPLLLQPAGQRHFELLRHLGPAGPGPVLLYNFPERTGYDLRPDLVLELATRHPNIVGIKDTVPNMGHTRALIQKVKAARPEFLVFSGFDEFFGHNVLSGGDGCIAGLSNFAPEVAAGYAQRARQDDLPGMAQYQRKVDSLMAIYDVAPQFVPTIKQAMALRGLGLEPFCAPPVLPSTPAETQQVRALLQQAGLLD